MSVTGKLKRKKKKSLVTKGIPIANHKYLSTDSILLSLVQFLSILHPPRGENDTSNLTDTQLREWKQVRTMEHLQNHGMSIRF